MRLLKLKCSNCNAQLDIDFDGLQAYCPYCGQKLLFDLEQMDHILAEKEQTKRACEQTKQAEEATKRVRIKNEYMEKRDRRDNAKIVIGWAFILILFLACLFFEEVYPKINNEIRVSVSVEDLKKESVESAVKILRNYGFQNIDTNNMGDLVFGVLSKEGEINSISINGDSAFSKGNWFPADAVVVITYHGFPEN